MEVPVNWDHHRINLLVKEVYRKYDSDFRDDPEAWNRYLEGIGAERAPYTYIRWGKKENTVWFECPWSIHSSTPGFVSTKSSIRMSVELAEKILTLGMP